MPPKKKLKILYASVILTAIISGLVLFLYEKKNNDPSYKKSWVVFSYTNPSNPEDGVIIKNYLGEKTKFLMCIVPDDNNLTEPNQLSCDLEEAFNKEDIVVKKNSSETWQIPEVFEKGKHWVVLEYEAQSKKQVKSLSFEK